MENLQIRISHPINFVEMKIIMRLLTCNFFANLYPLFFSNEVIIITCTMLYLFRDLPALVRKYKSPTLSKLQFGNDFQSNLSICSSVVIKVCMAMRILNWRTGNSLAKNDIMLPFRWLWLQMNVECDLWGMDWNWMRIASSVAAFAILTLLSFKIVDNSQ